MISITNSNINAPYLRAYSASNQTPTVATWTKVNVDTVVIDTGGYFNVSTHLWTPLIAGTYMCVGIIDMISTLAAASTYSIGLAKNGTRTCIGNYTGSVGFMEFGPCITDMISFNGSTDTLELQGNIGAGTGPTFSGGIQTTYLEAFRIGP